MRCDTAIRVAVACVVWVCGLGSMCAFGGEPRYGVLDDAGSIEASDAQYHMTRYLSLPDVWQYGFVCLAKAGGVQSRDGRDVRGIVKLDMEQDFGDVPVPAKLIFPAGMLQQMTGGNTWMKSVEPGERLLVRGSGRSAFIPQAIHAIAVQPNEQKDWAASLKLIQSFRKADGKSKTTAGEALLAAKTDIAVQYLGRELSCETYEVPQKWKPLLLKARDDESLYAITRLLMSEALHRHYKEYRDRREHVRWIRQWFEGPRGLRRKDCEDLLKQLRTYFDPKEYEAVELPMMMKLVRSPKTGEREATCILTWIAYLGQRVTLDPDVQGKTISLLLDAAFAQAGLERAQEIFFAAGRVISTLASELMLSPDRTPASIRKGVQMLKGYEKFLSENSKRVGNWDERESVRYLIKTIHTMIDTSEKMATPATTPSDAPL